MSRVTGRGAAGVSRTQYADIGPLQCVSGGTIESVTIAYESWGTLTSTRDNAILVCHALSGDAHAAGWSADDSPTAVDGIGAEEQGIRTRSGLGWWDLLIGPGKAFDTNRYFVLCTNVVGGCRGSTGPASLRPGSDEPYGMEFPVLTVTDMVRAQRMLLDKLGIRTLHAVAGGSVGGMQAMEWTLEFPDAVRGCIMTASTAALGAQGVAWNAIARNAIMADPDWQDGRYYGTGRSPAAGMGIARMVGHVTYLSAQAVDEKFGRALQDRNTYSYSLEEADFTIESYLRHQAAAFSRRFDANSYLYLSRALTYFDPARTRGDGSLESALAAVRAPYLLISFSSDWLYPSAGSARLHAALRAAGKASAHHEIETTYGHDSFLLEDAHQAQLIRDFLATV